METKKCDLDQKQKNVAARGVFIFSRQRLELYIAVMC